MAMRRVIWVSAAGLLSVLAGCTVSNERADIGEVVMLEAVGPARPVSPPSGEPSLSGLSRANWGTVGFVVPVAGTAGNQTYTRSHTWTNANARQRRQHPTAMSALDLGADEGDQWGEIGASGPLAFWDFLLMFPHLYTSPPWTELRGVQEPYWRAPATTTRRPGGFADPSSSP